MSISVCLLPISQSLTTSSVSPLCIITCFYWSLISTSLFNSHYCSFLCGDNDTSSAHLHQLPIRLTRLPPAYCLALLGPFNEVLKRFPWADLTPWPSLPDTGHRCWPDRNCELLAAIWLQNHLPWHPVEQLFSPRERSCRFSLFSSISATNQSNKAQKTVGDKSLDEVL